MRRAASRITAQYMDIHGLAETIGVNVKTIYRWRATGVDLPAAVLVGARLRWRQETVAEWAAAREATAAGRRS